MRLLMGTWWLCVAVCACMRVFLCARLTDVFGPAPVAPPAPVRTNVPAFEPVHVAPPPVPHHHFPAPAPAPVHVAPAAPAVQAVLEDLFSIPEPVAKPAAPRSEAVTFDPIAVHQSCMPQGCGWTLL